MCTLQFRRKYDGTITLVSALDVLFGGERELVSWFVDDWKARFFLPSGHLHEEIIAIFRLFYDDPGTVFWQSPGRRPMRNLLFRVSDVIHLARIARQRFPLPRLPAVA